MISYAQNAEDVVLARALPGPTGFYVDVGAADPEVASVTKHFYDRGWQGLNLEPRPEAAERLRDLRPRDTTLTVAAGDVDGSLLLFRPDADADQSTLDGPTREALLAAGQGGEAVEVPVRTLDGLLAEHQAGKAEPLVIDFLKIDVEGAEEQVLLGIDLPRWRPTIIVIEAIRPWSRDRTDAAWRRRIEAAGYRQACFDGINLFFARDDRPDVVDALTPASVLDRFVPAGVALLQDEITRLRAYVGELQDELDRHRRAQAETETYVRHLESSLGPSGPTDQPAPPPGPVEVREPQDSGLGPTGRPWRPARIAVIATPRTGNTWIRRVLADSLDAAEVPVHHPGDLAWGDLPARAVLQLHWPRTAALEEQLAGEDFVVVSPARHPLDVLLSTLHFLQQPGCGAEQWLNGRTGVEGLPGLDGHDPAFLDWCAGPGAAALLAVTPHWWENPSTVRVRYEDLVDDPATVFAGVLDAAEQRPARPVAEAVAGNTADRIHALSGGIHVWKARPGMWREVFRPDEADRLLAAHRTVLDELGY